MQIVESFRNIFKIAELRRRILVTLALLGVFRLGAHIVLPGVDATAVEAFVTGTARGYGNVWDFLQIFSGGALGNLALFSMGIMPYITASIIMQLMTKVSPNLEAVVKEGPAGQRKINQYTRYLTIPICIVQGFLAINMLVRLQQGQRLLYSDGWGARIEMLIGLTAGALFVMWLGEQITEHGVGNGASLLIMSGIVARLPASIGEMIRKTRQSEGDIQPESLLILAVLFIGMIFAVVFVTQAQRRIPVQHPKHFRGGRIAMGTRNYLPLRVNTAGVMPVIFASSLLVIPQMLSQIPVLRWMQEFVRSGTFLYVAFYTVMIFFFSYFWTYLFFQPVEMANNLKEYGSFVPGIRPGENTANYINAILGRITLCGAAFLAVVALMPDMVSAAYGGEIQKQLLRFLGGTGILIVVGVSLDIIQKIESYLLMHNYEGFVGAGGIRGRR